MRRTRLATVLATLPLLAWGASADEPQPAKSASAFWTAEELAWIDRGLEAMNLDRRDLGFQKRPIDDPFRLSVVNRALDDPLSVGDEAQAWDDVARKGDPVALLDRAASTLEVTLPERGAVLHPAVDLDAPGLPAGVLGAFRPLLGALLEAQALLARRDEPWKERADAVLRRAMTTQVEKPAITLPGGDLADEAFLAEIARADRVSSIAAARALLASIPALVRAAREADPAALAALPAKGLRVGVETGSVLLFGPGDDVHEGADDVAMVIDFGGDDTWTRGASAHGARTVSVCIDLGGNDRYVGRRDLSFGGALGGVAIQWDAGGDDLYDAGHASLGAGIVGVGVLVDEGGDDLYRCRDFGVGAGAFGVGLFLDRAGNDASHVDLHGQGFASTRGVGVCADLAGHDGYDAGGAHSDAPLHRDRFLTLSQGFSIGMRPDASGGVGVLVDVAGNDRYATDVYGQGASYWFSLGLLVDDDGNDTYACGHYGQGAGIHLSAGMLLDRAGQDLYYTQYGVGIGGAHDLAVGLLVDRGGDDHYAGSGGSQGGSLSNSVAILLDAAGDDGYVAVRRGASHGSAAPARESGGIGLLLDGAGKDVYSEPTRDGTEWAEGLVGVGLDRPTPPGAPAEDPMAAAISPEAAKAHVDREGTVAGPDGAPRDDLDRLWAIGKRWQVGDERVIGPIARARLVALGAPALDRAVERLGSKDGLELECVQAVLQGFPREQVVPRLVEATRAPDAAVRRSAVRMLGSLKAKEAEGRLVELLADAEVRTQALRALGALGVAPPAVLPWLRSANQWEGVAAVACLGSVGDAAAVEALVAALAPDVAFPVRVAAEARLSALGERAAPALASAATAAKTVRERRSALRALGASRSAAAVPVVRAALADPDPWVRLTARFAAEALARDLPGEATADLAAEARR